jgi:hypothetical protein
MRFQLQRLGFQYLSDVHLERATNLPTLCPAAEHLLLAGDIGHPHTDLYRAFLNMCSRQFRSVILIMGNHEWDRGNPYPALEHLPKNIHVLENQIFEFPSAQLTILGCTLWTPSVRAVAHRESVHFLSRELQRAIGRGHETICVTHHLPSYQLILPRYRHYPRLDRFATTLDPFMHAPWAPRVWVCGHSHCILEKTIGNTKCRIHAQPAHFISGGATNRRLRKY